MKILKVVCENFVAATPEVVKWNSWDSEHLNSVHGAYDAPKYLLTREGEVLFVDRVKVPFFRIRLKCLVFAIQWDSENQITYTLTPFFLAKNTINVQQINDGTTRVRVIYEFSGNWIQALLFPIFKILIQRWNQTVWEEDLPLKLRRQKALSYGFIDFRGIPDKMEMRKDRTGIYKASIPVPTTRNVEEFSHPFFISGRS